MSLLASVRWAALSQATRVGSQLVSLIVLARLLPPQAYGLIAMALTVTNLAFMFRDLGTMAAIVQRPVLTERLKSTLYWFNAASALAIGLILLALAVPVAAAYHEPRLALIICALALTVPLSSVAAVQQALMERDSQFRVLARIEASSAAAGVVLALLLAAAGAEVWSLVFQMLLTTALIAILSWRASRWRPRLLFDTAELRSVIAFSGHYSLFQFINYIQRNADSAIIGKMLGSAALGLYSMASKVMLFPLQNITGVVVRVLLPAMSRRQHCPDELGLLFLRASVATAMVTAPLMAGLHFLREPFVELAFGPRWLETAGLLKWLSAVGFIQSLSAAPGAVLLALGKTQLMLQLSVLGAVAQVACLWIGVHWGTQGVAVGYLLANLLGFAPVFGCVVALLALSPPAVLAELCKPMLAAGFMLLALWLLQRVTPRLPLAAGFALNVAAGALAYAFALLVLLRQDMSDMRALFRLRQA